MFKKRLDNSLALLKDLGLSRMNYAPMFYRLFWLLNIPVPVSCQSNSEQIA